MISFGEFIKTPRNATIVIIAGALLVAGIFIGFSLLREETPSFEERNNEAVLTVNGDSISRAEFNRRVAAMTQANRVAGNPPEAYANLPAETKEFFIELLLLRQELKKFGVVSNEAEIRDEMEQRAQAYGSLDAYIQFYKDQYGWEEPDIRLVVEHALLRTHIARFITTRARLKAIWIASPVGDTPYENFQDLPGDLRERHEERKSFASDITERAQKGEDFAQLARTYSEDETSRAQNGDIGWLTTELKLPTPKPQITGEGEGAASKAELEEGGDIPSVYSHPLALAFRASIQIFAMEAGGVQMFDYPGGFLIVRVEEKGGDEYATFDDWLIAKKSAAEITSSL